MAIESRMKKLEAKGVKKELYSDILELIQQKAFYDELTDIQKRRYVEYYVGDAELIKAFEQIIEALEIMEAKKKRETAKDVLHFHIKEKEKALTVEELEELIENIERI